ncbi:hypothetical protein DLD77_03705 [Chitinophaga alhagiae]|uniref:Glycoside hydrolase 123 catalytic domain-containing protein n=1 Tax=Chitinophaga alhagiae TaxID=2203219 RepID=A0ABN5LRR2_9BACT|nr:glycoside hydrolase domain-containing protein [Chitinophaga alhagiae]AWO00863.1 hypothetical protein DLD77_03705 [Chitinophaga alhagiae]
MPKLLHFLSIAFFFALAAGCQPADKQGAWSLAVLPSSVRLNPATNEIIETRFAGYKKAPGSETPSLRKNWVYDGAKATLRGARGEYVSFQLVVSNHTADSVLKAIQISLPSFSKNGVQLNVAPELFLEWAVEVKAPSTGYPKASLGKGWYPDALIPMQYVQADSSAVHGRWVYPLWLPDFNNRIDDQQSLVVWVDQFIPFEGEKAPAGEYTSAIAVTIGGHTQEIPVTLHVWDFALPNSNELKASLQQEGFLSSMNEKQELEYYQLFKRNRIALMDPTYKPVMQEGPKGISLDWKALDERLNKYFTGKAFTEEYGYRNGPGYGEPIETFVLPFDVHGKHGELGWPETGSPAVERNPENKSRYVKAIQQVREHLKGVIDPQKTDITVYLNGLDESYNQEAYTRMIYYGQLFREFYPEAYYRIDGAYDESAMEQVHSSISSWASHTINYDPEKVGKYQEAGLKVWLYGPMVYEGKVNSWVGSSSFTDLPLLNDRAISWASWKYKTRSWLSWGIGVNGKGGWYDPESWKDEYKEGSDSDPDYTYKKLNGSSLMVYSGDVVPHVSGPCPSIRLKAMRDGVQEYEYLRLLQQLDGNSTRADSIVNTIIKKPFGEQSIGNLDVWSYDPQEWDNARLLLGRLISDKVQQR